MVTKISKIEIIELHYNIWYRHGKCIQISTNMPGIGSLICEIDIKIDSVIKKPFAE